MGDMFEISREKNWQRITRIIFIFFCMVSIALFFGFYSQFNDEDADINQVYNVGILWTLLLLAWLGARWRYRLVKKLDSNRIK